MRGRVLLLLAFLSAPAWTGCKTKPVRVIKAPTEQLWDLPPPGKAFDEPPTYPEDKPLPIPQKTDGTSGIQMNGNRSPGGGGMGGGGMGGPSMGNPNMGGGGSGYGSPGRGY